MKKKQTTNTSITKLEKDVKRGKARYANIQGYFAVYGIYLSTNAKWVYVCILLHKLGQDAQAFPSLKTLSRLANLSKTTTIAAIAELEHFGWIQKESGKEKMFDETQAIKNNIYNPTVPTTGNYNDKGELEIVTSPESKDAGDAWRKQYNSSTRKKNSPKLLFPKSEKSLEEIRQDKENQLTDRKEELKFYSKGYHLPEEEEPYFDQKPENYKIIQNVGNFTNDQNKNSDENDENCGIPF